MKSRARFIHYDTENERIASVEAQLADLLGRAALRVMIQKAAAKRKAAQRQEASDG